ncbi:MULTISPECIES: hypothetical protein [Natrialbaceae]|uniref:hypothetical protein n=1 Tax=Natrialbaceae TaxID=1644061 RepID=UPI00207CC084|nr:hypothetical protein [Natronococcus sp. CG52]
MTRLDRRTSLSLLAAGMASLAGCSETSDETDDTDDSDSSGSDDSESVADSDHELLDDGDLPSYASLLRETDRSSSFYGAIAFGASFQRADLGDDEQPTDSLLVNPIAFAQLSSFGLAQLGDSPAVEAFNAHGETSDASAFVYADGVYAITGTYERDDLTDALEETGYDPAALGDAYAVSVDGESGEAVGVTDELFAYSYPSENDAFDPATAVEGTVATAAGERKPKYEIDDEFAGLLRADEADGISLGLYAPDEAFTADDLENDQTDAEADELGFQFDAIEGAAGIHQQLSLDGGSATANAVVSYRDDDRVDVDRLESSFGTDADDVETVRDGTAVAIEAAYDDTAVEEE